MMVIKPFGFKADDVPRAYTYIDILITLLGLVNHSLREAM